jgi:hypothetical protein
LRAAQSDTWVVASNIGPYSKGELAPIRFISALYGANVVFPKQLMAAELANALRAGRHGSLPGRAKIETEFESMLEAGNYEGLGWSAIFRRRMLWRLPSLRCGTRPNR